MESSNVGLQQEVLSCQIIDYSGKGNPPFSVLNA
jgi:hypothetical protein